MNTLTDCVRQSLDIARAVVALIHRRKFRIFLITKTWSGAKIGDGISTFNQVEMGHFMNGKIYAPHIEERDCSIVVAGQPEHIKLKVIGLVKSYCTSTTTAGYTPSNFALPYLGSTEYQFQVENIDTKETQLYQLTNIHEFDNDQMDIELESLGTL